MAVETLNLKKKKKLLYVNKYQPPTADVLTLTFTRVHKYTICANGPLNTSFKISMIASPTRGYSLCDDGSSL